MTVQPLRPRRLSTEEFRRARETFVVCQKHALGNLIPTEVDVVEKWINTFVVTINPSFSIRPDSLMQFTDQIFSDVTVRNFVLNLSYVFFATCAEGEDFAKRLAESISDGLSLDGPYPQLSLIPEKIKESMPATTIEQMRGSTRWSIWFKNITAWLFYGTPSLTLPRLLESNKHLLVVFMFYVIYTYRTDATDV